MKKHLQTVIFILLLCALFCISAAAAPARVVDGGTLLFDYEISQLSNKLAELSDRYGVDIVVVTTETLEGKSAAAYADDYYDYNGYAADGILLLVAMDEREWFISTAGSCIDDITDDGILYMADDFLPYLSDGEYYSAFRSFAEGCEELLSRAASGEPFVNQESFPFVMYAGISLGVGVLSAWIATSVMKGKLKSVHPQNTADDYVRRDSMQLTQQADLFLYSRVTRVAKPKDNGSKSGVRVSSSGRSHGGRGGRF